MRRGVFSRIVVGTVIVATFSISASIFFSQARQGRHPRGPCHECRTESRISQGSGRTRCSPEFVATLQSSLSRRWRRLYREGRRFLRTPYR